MPELVPVTCPTCGQETWITPKSVAFCSRDHHSVLMVACKDDDDV